MAIGHPNGSVEQVVGYVSLEFRGKVQAGNNTFESHQHTRRVVCRQEAG